MKRIYPKQEIALLGLINEGFAKIGTIKQGKDGSLYATYKIKGIASHYSYHSDGTHQWTFGDKCITRQKLKPLDKIGYRQEYFQASSVESMKEMLDITEEIKKKDGLLCIDLRECISFKLSLHYCRPSKLHLIKRSLKFFNTHKLNVSDIYISTKTNPYIVIFVIKDLVSTTHKIKS